MRDAYGEDPNPWGEPPQQYPRQQGTIHNNGKDLDVDNTTFLMERMAASASSSATSSTAMTGEGSQDVMRYFNTSATSTGTHSSAASFHHHGGSSSHHSSNHNNSSQGHTNSSSKNNINCFSPGDFSALGDHSDDDDDDEDDPFNILNTSGGLFLLSDHDQDDQEILNDGSSSHQAAPHDTTTNRMGQDEKQPQDQEISREPEHLVNEVDAALMALETSKKKRDLDECHQPPSEPVYEHSQQQFLQNPSRVVQPRRHSMHSSTPAYYSNRFHRRASAGGGYGSESIIHENSQLVHMTPNSSSTSSSSSLSTHPHVARQHQLQTMQQDHQVGSLYRRAQELHHHHRLSDPNQILPTRRSSTGTVVSTSNQDLSDYMDPSLFSSRETAKELTRALLIDDNSNNFANVNNHNNNHHNAPVVQIEEEDTANNDHLGRTHPISPRPSSSSLSNMTPYTPGYNINRSHNGNNNSHLLNTMSLYPPPVMDEDRGSFLSPEGASPSLAVNFPTSISRARKQQRRCSLPAMSLGYNGMSSSSSGIGTSNNTNNKTQRYKTPEEQEEALQEMLIYQQKVLAEMAASLKEQQLQYQQQRETYEQQQQQQQQKEQQRMGYTGQDAAPRDFQPPSPPSGSAVNAFAQMTLSPQTLQQQEMSTPTHTMSQQGMWATPDTSAMESSSNVNVQQQNNGSPDLSAAIAERLANLMQKSSKTQVALQEWDKQNGLPKSHSQTMVKSARSRRQLIEGIILKKWDGSPLIGKSTKNKDGVACVEEKHNKKMKKAARRMSAPAISYVRNVTPPIQVTTTEEPLKFQKLQPLPKPTHLACSKPQPKLEESPPKEPHSAVYHSTEIVDV